MSGLLNKVALVTGAGSGIGLATAQRLSADGYAVAAIGRSAAKLECISAAIDRAIARAASSAGQNTSRPTLSAR